MHALFTQQLPEYLAVTSIIAMSKSALGLPTLRKEIETKIKQGMRDYAAEKNYSIDSDALDAFFEAYFELSKVIQDHIRTTLINDDKTLDYQFSPLEIAFLNACKSQFDKDEAFDIQNVNNANVLYQEMLSDQEFAQDILIKKAAAKIARTNPTIVDSLHGDNHHSGDALKAGFLQALSGAVDPKLLEDPAIEATANTMVEKAIQISPKLNDEEDNSFSSGYSA